jgi:hypothetical protein
MSDHNHMTISIDPSPRTGTATAHDGILTGKRVGRQRWRNGSQFVERSFQSDRCPSINPYDGDNHPKRIQEFVLTFS